MADQFGELFFSRRAPITTKQQSTFWLVSQSQHMSATYVGRLFHLRAGSGAPVVQTSAMYITLIQPATGVTIRWLPIIRRRNLATSLICHLSTVHECYGQTDRLLSLMWT